MPLDHVAPRKRGRPRKDGANATGPVVPPTDSVQLVDMSRLQQLETLLRDLQKAWDDTGMSHRDRAAMATRMRNLTNDIQAEKQRIAASQPAPLVEVDADALVAEVLAGLELLPRVLVDRIVAGALDIQARK